MFGTLIFEWDAGKLDIVELVSPAESRREKGGGGIDFFDQGVVDGRYADMLVDLAVERGFDGWLINVEVELGSDAAHGARGNKEQHAEALIAWLEHLTLEMHRRVPDGEVMWYDAVTIEGKLEWQNTLNERNLPFLRACDSIFLNYFWSPRHVAATLQALEEEAHSTSTLRPSQVCFGIDVFGRGTYGGGGFETWRALDAIFAAHHRDGSRLSVALFAPGWTVESSDLGHGSLESSREAYETWFDDELYLWTTGARKTRSVPRELERMRRVRRDQAGVDRARLIAHALRRDPRLPPLRMRAPIEPVKFDLERAADVANSGDHHAIDSFFRPRRSGTRHGRDLFYTNFSSGSGHAFHVDGREVGATSDAGWTDLDHTFAFPNLVFASARESSSCKASFTEEPGRVWQGERSIEIEIETGPDDRASRLRPVILDVVSTDYTISQHGNHAHRARVVYKVVPEQDGRDESTDPRVDLDVKLFGTTSVGGHEQELASEAVERGCLQIEAGWTEAITELRVAEAGTVVSKVSIMLARRRPCTIVLGAVSIYPVVAGRDEVATIGDIAFDEATLSLAWTAVSSLDGGFVFYHVYRRRRDGIQRDGREDEYLGTTRETRFRVASEVVRGFEVMVKGVGASGARVASRAETIM